MDSAIYRVVAIVVHIVLNIIIISKLTSADISGSWLKFLAFFLAVLLLLTLFVLHLISLIKFLKTR